MNRIGIALAAALVSVVVLGQKPDAAEVELKAAMHKEQVDGDLKGAIAQYQKILTTRGVGRAVAATALLHLGQCHEKLGDAEARKAYERLVMEFADQAEPVKVARSRLSAMGAGPGRLVRQLWSGTDVNVEGGISPDGRYFVYGDWETGNVAIRELATGEKRLLTKNAPWAGGEFAMWSRFSPDGKQVAYTQQVQRGGVELRIVGLDGSQPRLLYANEKVGYLDNLGWSPDGKHVLVVFPGEGRLHSQIVLVSVTDGSVRVLKTLDWGYPSTPMSFSPDGRYVAYDAPPREDVSARDIFLLPVDGSREVPLVEHPANDSVLGWTPDGKRILFASDRTGSTDAWTIEVADGKPQGAAELVKRDMRGSPLGFDRSGSYYYVVRPGMKDVYLSSLDLETGRLLTPPTPVSPRFLGSTSNPDWSADGRYLAYVSKRAEFKALGSNILVIRNIQTGEERELAPKTLNSISRPRWAPDGRSILVNGVQADAGGGLFRIDLATGETSLLVRTPGDSYVGSPAWSPDGKVIFYLHRNFKEKVDRILSRNVETGEEQVLWRGWPFFGNLVPAPDGRQLAAASWNRLEVLPRSGGEVRELLKLQDPERMSLFCWTPDGRYLLFSKKHEETFELWRIAAEGGQPERLGPLPKTMGGGFGEAVGGALRLHPDGRRVASTSAEDNTTEVWVMENFLPAAKAAQ